MSDGRNDVASPDEAFGVVASERRFDILQALWEETTETEADSVGFATLRRRTGIDDSGQFNYHLDTLTPRFVRRTEEGYALTHAGRQVIGAAVSGVYTDADTTVEPRTVGECPACAGDLEASYEGGEIRVACRQCEQTFVNAPAPPVIAASFDDDLPAVYSRHVLTELHRINAGFCVLCGGPLDGSLAVDEDEDADAQWGGHVNTSYRCRECGMSLTGTLVSAAIDHPAVVSFLHDAGIDLRETPIWELDWVFDAPGVVRSEDPLRVATTIEIHGPEMTLTLDDSLDVVDYEVDEGDGDGDQSGDVAGDADLEG